MRGAGRFVRRSNLKPNSPPPFLHRVVDSFVTAGRVRGRTRRVAFFMPPPAEQAPLSPPRRLQHCAPEGQAMSVNGSDSSRQARKGQVLEIPQNWCAGWRSRRLSRHARFSPSPPLLSLLPERGHGSGHGSVTVPVPIMGATPVSDRV